MRIISLLVLAVFCVCAPTAPAWSQAVKTTWVLYGSTPNFDSYYDTASAYKTPEGIIMVVAKFIYTDKHAQEFAQSVHINTPIKMGFSLEGFDCSNRSMTIKRSLYYAQDGSQLRDMPGSNTFTAVKPGSVGETLLDILCARQAQLPVQGQQAQPKQQPAAPAQNPKPKPKPKSDTVLDKYN